MKNIILLMFLNVASLCCSFAQGSSNQTVDKAILLQQNIINDTLFEKILTELEASRSIDWGDGRTNKIKEKLSNYSSNTEWLLSKYKKEGGFNNESVYLWKKWNPWSSTTAVTSTCGNTTKLNTRALHRDEYSTLNTLIHERVHSFCQIHGKNQTRPTNKCDAAYIAGDLSEILILYRMGIKERKMDKPICPELLKKIEEYKLIQIK